MGHSGIDISGIVIICGNYGSGKTETAVNLAVKRKADGLSVKIADLDLVNPYFRTREASIPLETLGIEVVLPERKYLSADLPILTPAVSGMIRQPADLTLLDAGGDDVGVTVLAALENHLKQQQVSMLQVINPFRPFTRDVDGCLSIKGQIETSSKLDITGFAGNANLMDETEPDHIYMGYDLLEKVARTAGLPLKFITAETHMLEQLDLARFDCPVLEIDRKLNMPWKRHA